MTIKKKKRAIINRFDQYQEYYSAIKLTHDHGFDVMNVLVRIHSHKLQHLQWMVYLKIGDGLDPILEHFVPVYNLTPVGHHQNMQP